MAPENCELSHTKPRRHTEASIAIDSAPSLMTRNGIGNLENGGSADNDTRNMCLLRFTIPQEKPPGVSR